MGFLAGGLFFHWVSSAAEISASDLFYYTLVFATFLVALALNFSMIGVYKSYMERSSFFANVRTVLVPVLPSELGPR